MRIDRCFCFSLALFFTLGTFAVQPKKSNVQSPVNLTQYVDPTIGTGGDGHVFLGADVPFGMVQLGPSQVVKGWGWCSGYHYSDSVIIGFSHTHLSGTGIGSLGDILMFPTVNQDNSSKFSHKNEVARPGYYAVKLDNSGIKAELTATARVGFHRYTYPKSDAKLIVNLEYGIGWDHYVSGKMTKEGSNVISGYRVSTGWAKHRVVYFTAIFSAPIKDIQSVGDTINTLSFQLPANHQLLVKVAISPVSVANAKLNMQAELPGWNFNATVAAADKAWNEQLNRIVYKTNNPTEKKTFYTALYHTMIAPSLFCDVNGDYYGSDGKIYRKGGFKNYTVFSLWDTYRAAQPLMTLIHRDMLPDMAQTFLHIFAQQGKLPVWHLWGNETDCMVGNPGICALADMFLKGVPMNKEEAFNAMKKSAMLDERGMKELKEYGYIPYDKTTDSTETVSRGLEYALADWCVAQAAKELNKQDDYKYFLKRSNSYTKYFDKRIGLVRAIDSRGKFREPFSPFFIVDGGHNFTEGNAWQYTWLVPEDVHGLIREFGGDKPFLTKLDSLFIAKGDLGKNAPPDVAGMIGQYDQGNEPVHQVLYMYAFAGEQWKSSPLIRQSLTTLYSANKNGMPGNDDVGQMAAWYVLSSMGIYQVEPAGGRFIFGTPMMNEAIMKVGAGRTFRIVVHNNSSEKIYIQSAKLNGKIYTKSYIDYIDIIKGGTLEFTMGDKQSNFGTAVNDRP